jgi:hypothetical protein
MSKIPVGKTIAYAYSFTFGHLGTIIGLVWLPLVLKTVLNFLPHIAGNGIDPTDLSPLMQASQAIGGVAIVALSLLLNAMIYVAVTRQALGLRQGGATVHFALGMPEFRAFGALLLLVVIALAFMATYMGATLIAAAAGERSPPMAVVAGVIAIGGAFAFVYILLRLAFFVAPVIVAEDQANLGRGWTLAQGNFWRILAVVLATGVPLMVAYMIGTWILLGSDATTYFSPAAAASNLDAMVKHEMLILDRHLPALLGLDLILAPFNLGLIFGASAFAYRAVVQDSAVARTA